MRPWPGSAGAASTRGAVLACCSALSAKAVAAPPARRSGRLATKSLFIGRRSALEEPVEVLIERVQRRLLPLFFPAAVAVGVGAEVSGRLPACGGGLGVRLGQLLEVERLVEAQARARGGGPDDGRENGAGFAKVEQRLGAGREPRLGLDRRSGGRNVAQARGRARVIVMQSAHPDQRIAAFDAVLFVRGLLLSLLRRLEAGLGEMAHDHFTDRSLRIVGAVEPD